MKEKYPLVDRYDQEIYNNNELRQQLRVRRIEAFLQGLFSIDQLLQLEQPAELTQMNQSLRNLLQSAQETLKSGLDNLDNLVHRILPVFGPVE